jgi:hypothetical protein
MRIIRTICGIVGSFLLLINLYGLNRSLRNEELYDLEKELKNRINDVVISYPAILDSLKKKDIETAEEFAIRANQVVHNGYAHYWKKEGMDRFYLRVPIWENYILYVASFLNPKRYERYEFANYEKSLERGVGLCSSHSQVLKGALKRAGIKAQLLDVGGRHVVLRAELPNGEAILLDPDYGIMVPHDTAAISANPELVRPSYGNMHELYYEQAKDPYTTDFMVDIYGAPKHTYEIRDGFENGSYLLKWILPFAFLLFAGILYWRRNTLK